MSKSDILTLGFYFISLFVLTPVLGSYMARVFSGQKHLLSFLNPIERFIYKVALVDPKQAMNLRQYSAAIFMLNILGIVAVFMMQICQSKLPLNPWQLPDVRWDLALNTAVSFVTNTNWQSYAGENTLSYLASSLGLGVQNFLSAGTGMAVFLVLVRGLKQRENPKLGNFWEDITRGILYILLPLSLLLALALVSQGVIQNYADYVLAFTLEGQKQILPMGPAASQQAISLLGTNGGGFYGASGTHPFLNPTLISNFLSMLAILLIPAALVYCFGVMAEARKQAALIFSVMTMIFGLTLTMAIYAEQSPNKSLEMSKNLEGIETRIGPLNSISWAMATTASSNGAVNSMHDSLPPLVGGGALLLILLGEVAFGGVGSGLYGMLLFVMFSIFLAGLMIGRTPDYFGKKLEAYEIKLVVIAILLPGATVLLGCSLSIFLEFPLSSLANFGPHGLSELLYAWGSTANNNGSAFAGLNSNTNFYNIALVLAMLLGRFGVIIPVLAIASSLSLKKPIALQNQLLEQGSFTFGVLLFFVIIFIGALTFIPAFMLGPLVEHFLMNQGISF